MNIGSVAHDPVGTGGAGYIFFDRRAKSDDLRSRGFTGAHSGGSVFDHDTFRGRKSEEGSAAQIRLGIGLAFHDVVGGDHSRRQRKAGGFDANFGQAPSAGGHDGPAIRGKARQQLKCAGQRHDALEVFNFAPLHFAVFGNVIGVGKIVADGADAGSTMGAGHDFLGIESVLNRPLAPDAGDSGSGVDENSI